MHRLLAPLLACALAVGTGLLCPAAARAQASGSVDVSVQIVPAATFVAEAAPLPSGARSAAQGLATMRVIGAANCRLEADVGGERMTLGACGEQSLLSDASQRLLNRRAAGRPVLVTVTVDAGT
jgi:hypothetical protein